LFAREADADTLRAILGPDPALPLTTMPRGLPTRLSEIAMRAITRDRTKRYATARALRHELLAFTRGYTSGEAPASRLASLMQTLFADRMQSTAAILRGLAADSGRSNVDAGTEEDIEPTRVAVPASILNANGVDVLRVDPVPHDALPTDAVAIPVDETITKENPAELGELLKMESEQGRASEPSERPLGVIPIAIPRRIVLAVAVVCVLCASVAAWMLVRASHSPLASIANGSDRAEPATPSSLSRPVGTPTVIDVPPVPADVEPAQAMLHVETIPAKATILVGGTVMGVSPMDLKLPKNTEPVDVEIRRAGYQTLTERVVPDMDQRLRLSLIASAVAPAPPPPTPRPAPSSQGPYHRFD
jgi:hypothetical protein